MNLCGPQVTQASKDARHRPPFDLYRRMFNGGEDWSWLISRGRISRGCKAFPSEPQCRFQPAGAGTRASPSRTGGHGQEAVAPRCGRITELQGRGVKRSDWTGAAHLPDESWGSQPDDWPTYCLVGSAGFRPILLGQRAARAGCPGLVVWRRVHGVMVAQGR